MAETPEAFHPDTMSDLVRAALNEHDPSRRH
jgi:hypothetical protein